MGNRIALSTTHSFTCAFHGPYVRKDLVVEFRALPLDALRRQSDQSSSLPEATPSVTALDPNSSSPLQGS